MSLLKRTLDAGEPKIAVHLHSTMSLLKPEAITEIQSAFNKFTFHYVSIKTHYSFFRIQIVQYLHSTMSLLKPIPAGASMIASSDLHSTMSLLKPTLLNQY